LLIIMFIFIFIYFFLIQMVLETVGKQGEYLGNNSQGRLLNPGSHYDSLYSHFQFDFTKIVISFFLIIYFVSGHAIEAGWFLLQYAHKYMDFATAETSNLIQTALDMINWSYETGWDKKYGGLFYFLDSVC